MAVLLRKQVGFCPPFQVFREHSVHLKQLRGPEDCREWGKRNSYVDVGAEALRSTSGTTQLGKIPSGGKTDSSDAAMYSVSCMIRKQI